MQSFPLGHTQRWEGGQNTRIKKPTEIAHFSYDSDHTLKPFSDVSLRYYYPPFFNVGTQDYPPSVDLAKGFNTFRNYPGGGDEHLDGLLATLVEAEKRSGARTEADVITWRGMMTKILTALYEDEEGFSMNATRFQDTIFIEEDHAYKTNSQGERDRRFNRPGGPPPELGQFYGYKFETLCLLDKPWAECSRDEIEGREDAVVDNYSQYCSICKTAMGGTSLVIGGEVDGVLDYKPDDPNQPSRWIELKVTRFPETEKNVRIHEKKLLKFWAQSFLLGVPKIIIGWRNRDGFLNNIDEVSTHSIPPMIKRTGLYKWNGNACINFASAFLDFLKTTIQGEGVWRISRVTRSPTIDLIRLTDTGTGDIICKQFLDWRNQMPAGHSAPQEAS